MDLVTGGELFDAVAEQGRLPEPLARSYFQQLVDGIHYCHSRRVYHRDLKPENLLLTADKKTIKITDFGLSSIKAENAASELLHTIMGSPHYIAPEIITSAESGYDGAKVDVWASGVILFGMLAGYLPFDETATRALYKAIVHNPVKYPPHFSYDCVKLLRAMLQKDPSRRPTMEQVKTFQWFRVNYEPPVVEESKEKTVESSSHRKKGKHKTKRNHRQPKRKEAQGSSSARSENETSLDSIPAVASPPHDEYTKSQLNTRSSVVVELRTASLEDGAPNKQSSSDSVSRQAGKENRHPSSSFLAGKKDASTNARNDSVREPLMSLRASENRLSSQRLTLESSDALGESLDVPVSQTLYNVDEHFDKLDDSASPAEDGAAAQHSAPASRVGTEDSFDQHAHSLERLNSVATDKRSYLRKSQGFEFCEFENRNNSAVMRISSHSERASLANSSSEFEEPTKLVKSHPAPFEPRAPSLNEVKTSSSNSTSVSAPQRDSIHGSGEKSPPLSLRIADEEERQFCREGQSVTPQSSLAHNRERKGSSRRPDLSGRFSDDTFEPASAQAFISPVSWNPGTENVGKYDAKTPTASRGMKFAMTNLDSPMSEGSIFSKANVRLQDLNAPRTDTSIFKPIKAKFEKLATAQTPKASQPQCSAPSVFSPQMGEEVDPVEDWNIDSASVFADVEADDDSDSFTPMSESSVNTPDTRWKFKKVLGRTSNKDEDSRKSIFAPLRLNISEKLSPSNK
ncbi:Serine/threonine-protein kinase [Gracilaria domingensis]|nr:Serine/threonine-protein kinase [Gracilaria domingensis]